MPLITLRAARVNSGYSQKEAAKLLGIHYQTLASLEKDSSQIPYAIIEKLESVYGVPADNIFFGFENEFIRIIRREE